MSVAAPVHAAASPANSNRTSMNKPRVCFVSLKVLAMLTGQDARGQIGGAEVQVARLARGLARRGAPVSIVTHDQDVPGGADLEGIELIPAFRPDAGLPLVRFFHPRWTGLSSALKRANADVYYQRAAGAITGQIAMYCRSAGKRFVFGVGSDSDCAASLHYLTNARDRWLYRYGLRNASAIVAQSAAQAAELQSNFGVESLRIASCAPRVAEQPRPAPQAGSPRLLWVGRLATEKRPEWFIEMARLRPRWTFRLVGDNNARSGFADQVRREAGACPNLTLLGAVPYTRMESLYATSDVLVNTSRWEGFPNTFLEAWAQGVPVTASVDPDGVVARNGVGELGRTPEELVQAVERLIHDSAEYVERSARCLAFVAQNYNLERVLDEYERLFSQAPVAPETG